MKKGKKRRFFIISLAVCLATVLLALLLPETTLDTDKKVLVFFSVAPLAILSWVIDVIRDGAYAKDFYMVRRAEKPIEFWFSMGFSILCALALWVFVIYKWVSI